MGRTRKLCKGSKESGDSSDDKLLIVDLKIKDEPVDDDEYAVLNETINGVAIVSDVDIKQEKEDFIAESQDSQNVKTAESEVTLPLRKTTRRSTGVAQKTSYYVPKKYTGGKSLSVDELSKLSGKQLVLMFSEMSSNEFTKNFAYACCLMPEKCNAFFTSFGNEAKAQNAMQKHLVQHVKELVDRKKKDKSFAFSTQTVLPLEEVTALKKRGKQKDNKFQKSASETGNNTSQSESLNTSGADLQAPTDETAPVNVPSDVLETINLDKIKIERVDLEESEILKELSVETVHVDVPNDENINNEILSKKKRKNFDDSEWTMKLQAIKKVKKLKVVLNSAPISPAIKPVSVIPVTEPSDHECNLEHPWCTDHMYDLRHRKCKTFDSDEIESSDSDDKESLLPGEDVVSCSRTGGFKYGADVLEGDFPGHFSIRMITLPDENINPLKLLIPIIKVAKYSLPNDLSLLPNDPHEMRNLEDDDIEILLPLKPIRGSQGLTASALLANESGNFDANTGSAFIAENYENVISEMEARELERFKGDYNDVQVKALAMFYIKELRMKKGPVSLYCKICTKKKFTAPATLMYHYKSHAGIKPYTCRRCGLTFTRQHSLNYHLLIHQNINRFQCPHCERQFRHPSHYKEHLRKHTGETPFSCTECETKFKTRNTFKRHMRTRHNKEVPSMVGMKRDSKFPRMADQLMPIAPALKKFTPLITGKIERKGVLTSVLNSSNGFSSIYPLNALGQQRHSNSLLSRSLIRTNLSVTIPVVKVKQEPNDVPEQGAVPTPICIAPIETSPASCKPASSASLLAPRPHLVTRRTPSILLNRNKPKILTKPSPLPPPKIKISCKPIVAKIPEAALLPKLEVITLKQ